MTKPNAKLDAFRHAQLKSERLRIMIIIVAVTAIAAMRILGIALVPNHDSYRVVIEGSVIAALFVFVELFILRDVHRAIKGGPELPHGVWLGSLVLEAALPAIGLAFLTGPAIDIRYRPVANVAVLWFFLFIIVSTLRLNPIHCRLAGVAAAISYFSAAFYLGWRPVLDSTVSVLAPERAVFSYALAYVVGGFVAGAVAGEICKHLNAALQ